MLLNLYFRDWNQDWRKQLQLWLRTVRNTSLSLSLSLSHTHTHTHTLPYSYPIFSWNECNSQDASSRPCHDQVSTETAGYSQWNAIQTRQRQPGMLAILTHIPILLTIRVHTSHYSNSCGEETSLPGSDKPEHVSCTLVFVSSLFLTCRLGDES